MKQIKSKCRVGILGTGSIANRYIEGLRAHEDFDVFAVASRTHQNATTCAEKYGIRAATYETLIDDPDVDYILNLTPPKAHFTLTRAALNAGKHVYSEKPLATSIGEADELIALAQAKRLLLACAPSTPLGPVWLKASQIIKSGTLGQIVSASGALVYPGPDIFHENPEHLFDQYGGPLFDMGVYHLSVLASLLGPIQSVQAVATQGQPTRIVKAGRNSGATFPVNVPTHFAVILQLSSGVPVSLTFSFEGFGTRAHGLEIVGRKASIALPQPGQFDGDILISEKLFGWAGVENDNTAWTHQDWVIGPVSAWRGGVLDMPKSLSGQFAHHILDTMLAIERASRRSSVEIVQSTF